MDVTDDPGCICKGNWRQIMREVGSLIDRRYRDHHGDEFVFFGLVHGSDDYYYGMHSASKGMRLLSCVGSIEGHWYTLLPDPPCDHEWVDVRNKVITSGEMCIKCRLLRSGNEATSGTPSETA